MSSTRVLVAFLIAWSATSSVSQGQGLRREPRASPLFGEVHRMLPRSTDSAVDLGDVDDLDAVIGARLYRNEGDGLLVDAPTDLRFDGDASGSVALGDVDGDGDLDALTGEQERCDHQVLGRQNRLYLNDGNGAFGGA